jgi:monoamine oxidase
MQALMATTHTWMADSIKLALVYSSPFWYDKQVSGTLFSNTGPVVEFYDHSNFEKDRFALCGFLHPDLREVEAPIRKGMVTQQLVKLFGAEAANFTEYREAVWWEELFTASPSLALPLPHQHNGHAQYAQPIHQRLYLAGTETSPIHGGYMEGAVFAAERMAKELL